MIKKKVVKKSVEVQSTAPSTNLDTVRKMMKGLDSGEKWWKPKQGENIIRILPSNMDDGNFAFEFILHFGFKDKEGNRAYPCLLALGQDVCPVCKLIAHHESADDEDVVSALKNLRPNRAFLMNIINRDATHPGVRLYKATVGVFKDIVSFFADTDYGDITDPEEGHDIKIERTGEHIQTRYKVRVRPKASPIGIKGWESKLFNLRKEAYREIPTYKEYVQMICDSYDDVLDTGFLAKAGKKSVKKNEEVDEDVEDLEEDDE